MATRQHDAMVQRIKATARQQMAVHGAGSLSLGAIARALGLSTPALYRYFDNRDALVTELILEAYDALSDEAETAIAALDDVSPRTRLLTLVRTYRRWALAHPQDYVLVHGAVLPGYRAPVEQIGAHAFRIMALFVSLLDDANTAGTLQIPVPYQTPPTAMVEATRALLGEDSPLPATMLTIAFLIWLQVHALVWEEVAGHLPPEILADGGVFEVQMALVCQQLGLG